MLFTFEDMTPVREQRCPPEVLGCFVNDIRHFQRSVEKMDDYMDNEGITGPKEDASFDVEEERLSGEIDLFEVKIAMAQEWLDHFRAHGVHDHVRAFSTFEMDVHHFCIDLEHALIRAEGVYRSNPELFHKLATEAKLIPGPFCHVLRIYGLLYHQDDVAAYTLHDEDAITGPDCYHRPEMGMVGAWTKKQIGDFLYAVIQKIENPAFLLACLSAWERGAMQEMVK